jgi:LmbE family N-acetylglucosaminyl deacetylase
VSPAASGGILGVFAHPDDEAYSMAGGLARYTDEGIGATILCFTRGEVGLIAEGSGATRENLGEVREAELRAACALVGVDDVRIVGTADSGTEQTPEGVDAIVATIHELRPRVVATMEPAGITHHPDHVAVSAMTTEAFTRARDESGGAYPERLYYSVIPQSFMDAFTSVGPELGLPNFFDPNDPLVPRPAPDSSVDCALDVVPWVNRKADALRAHLTQSMEMISWLPEDLYGAVLGMEAFQRPFPARDHGEAVETDWFAAYRASDGKIR